MSSDCGESDVTMGMATCTWPQRWPVLMVGENLLLGFLGHTMKSG